MDDIAHLRARVAKLERTVEFLLKHLELEYVDRPSTNASPEVVELVQQGNIIGAIKVYREETGVDLKTAKEFVEGLM